MIPFTEVSMKGSQLKHKMSVDFSLFNCNYFQPELDRRSLHYSLMLRLVDDPGGGPHSEGGRPGGETVITGDEMTGVSSNITAGHPRYPVLEIVLSLLTGPH